MSSLIGALIGTADRNDSLDLLRAGHPFAQSVSRLRHPPAMNDTSSQSCDPLAGRRSTALIHRCRPSTPRTRPTIPAVGVTRSTSIPGRWESLVIDTRRSGDQAECSVGSLPAAPSRGRTQQRGIAEASPTAECACDNAGRQASYPNFSAVPARTRTPRLADDPIPA